MAIPDFQSLMLPVLKIAGDGLEHRHGDVLETLALQFGLTDDERAELLADGRQTRFDNRVRWARVWLGKAGLIESTGRGSFRITQRGLQALKNSPPQIDANFLMQFPEFQEFRRRSRQNSDGRSEQTPEEVLESSYQSLRQSLGQELLDRIKGCPPKFFEQLVVELLVAMGYGGSLKDAGQAVGQSGDGGIDGIIKEDKLGLDIVYIQAKKWDSTVGRPIVQAFSGSLDGFRARKGVLLTTSQFSKDAREYVERLGEKKIVLIDGEQLAELMIDHGIGVTEAATYKVSKVDLDYFPDS